MHHHFPWSGVRFAASLLLLVGLGPSSVSAQERPKPAARHVARTELVMFEDNLLYATPGEGSLIYRVEGDRRGVERKVGLLHLHGGASYIHPAQYDRATVRLRLSILAGEPAIAICHNGMADVEGQSNATPGLQVTLQRHRTVVTDLRTGRGIAEVGEAIPRGREVVVSVAWDLQERWLRLDLPRASYTVRLSRGLCRRGGFAIRSPARPRTDFRIRRIQVIWEDTRDLVLYDGTDTVYDREGRQIGRVPPVRLPERYTSYATAAVDLRRERALIVYGGPDLNSDHPETLKGWAVRDLRTGRLERLFGPRINGCLPQQGGGSLDGFWLLQSWTMPASLCWVDWNAYDRGNLEGFVVPFKQAQRDGAKLVGFHDPSNALDGSMARYLRITESARGINHLTVHPNLRPFAPFDDVPMPPPTHPQVSHTGPAGLPTQLVVRDRDRAWYEQWAFLGNNLHYQSRGYNLFARRDDWAGPTFPVAKDADPYTDYANMTPDLRFAGRLMAPLIRFAAREAGAKRAEPLAVHRLRMGDGRFVLERVMPYAHPWPVPFEMLMDRKRLLPIVGSVGNDHR